MKKATVILLFACALAALTLAQTITSSIVGSVTDPSGAAVAGAAVTLTHVSTGAERQTKTGSRGDFVFTSLQLGEYNVSVTASGFKRLEKRGVPLSAQETVALGALVLEVGAVTESVTVTSQGVAVQTASSERAGTITGSQVENLMIKGRNAMSLLQLLPGVVDMQNREEKIDRNFDVYVQGSRRADNSVTIDGMIVNGYGNNFNTITMLGQDAIAEVRVLLTNYQAEYGRASGATVNLISKSGTKEFHGLGSFFRRHEQFNANNFFNNRLGQPKPRYRYKTWTYNVGGPISLGSFNRNKDKLFFFWSQEFWPLRVPTPIRQLTVPTALERIGDFSESLDVNNRLITITDPAARTPFPGNRIPQNRLDASGQALLKLLPLPNFPNRSLSGGNYNHVYQSETEVSTRMENLRADYNVNSRHTLSGSIVSFVDQQSGYSNVPTADNNTWDQMYRTYRLHGQAYVLRHTGVITPTLVSETSFGFTRRPEANSVSDEELRKNQRSAIGYTAGQLDAASNPLDLTPAATFGGVPNAAALDGTQRYKFIQALNSFAVTSNISKITGGHTIKFGINLERHAYGTTTTAITGTLSFARDVNNPLETGYAYSNAALGIYNNYTETFPNLKRRERQYTDEWFIQDNWKASRRLTLDLGVRFHHFVPIFRPDDLASAFVPGLYNPSRAVRLVSPALEGGRRIGIDPATGRTFLAAQIGAIVPGSGDITSGIVLAGRNGTPRGFVDGLGINIGPRFGFAYDVFGDGRMAVRGGFGLFYTRPNFVNNPGTQIPFVERPILYYGTLPTLTSKSGVVFPGSMTGMDAGAKTPRTMNFSLSVQRNIGAGMVVDVGYVGSLGRNLMWTSLVNAIPLGTNFDPAFTDPTRPGNVLPQAFLRSIKGFTDINIKEAASSSNYHSLQVTARRRFVAGLQFGAAWTWSKAMDFIDSDADVITPLVSPRIWQYGLAGFDRTHVFKFDWLWNVPKAPTGNRALRYVLNDWQLSGITSFVSGAPLPVNFTTTTVMDITGTPSLAPRINVTGNPVLPKGERSFSRNFRTDVFSLPARGSIGTAAKNIIRGPGMNNWDIALFKDFPIRERMRFQYRWEVYNAFNHAQFASLDTTARFDPQGRQVNTRLGEFVSARAPRVMQMALRFYF
ncbi:MAG: TonB-dependent receptor [Bryobacterales bacterium]|nr:TonB-dependent receptor [Bryobacterales bacterium]